MSLASTSQANHLISLIGDSLLQFVSLSVRRDVLARVTRVFAHEGDGADTLLLSFGASAEAAEHATYTVSGAAAAETFVDTWMPLPCFRRASAAGSVNAPTNWVRLRLLRENNDFRLVLAFDTALADASSTKGHVSPTLDDARSRTRFAFARTSEDIGEFVGEPWVDDWIAATGNGGPGANDTAQKLKHLAHFITLLEAFAEARVLPDVTLDGSATGRLGADVTSRQVDIALSFGDHTVDAHLIDVARFEAGSANAISTVNVRDLARPWHVHSGAIRAGIAFSRPDFGNDAASRVSGRADAFAWPSLVRIGGEADALARQLALETAFATETDLLGGVLDEAPVDHVWRMAQESSEGARLPFVSGPTLALVTETGERVAAGGGRSSATRARFSRSALISLAVHEAVLHAVASANPGDVQFDANQRAPAVLRRVLVSLPDGLHDHERAVMEKRITDGVAVAFDAMRVPDATRPEVRILASRGRSLVYAHLHNEIAHRFAGHASAYLRLLDGPLKAPVANTHVAIIDVGASRLTFEISRVTTDDTKHLALTQHSGDTAGIGLDAAAADLARDIIIPALAAHLSKARLADATGFLRRVLAPRREQSQASHRYADRIVLEAARGLMALHHKRSGSSDTLPVETTLRALLGAHADQVALRRLETLVLAEGANAVTLLDAPVTASTSAVQRITATRLMPALRAACRAVRRAQCKLLVVTGDAVAVAMAREAANAEACVSADRVVDLTRYRFAAWIGVDGVGAARAAGAALAAGDPSDGGPPAAQHFAFDDGAQVLRPIFTKDLSRHTQTDAQTHTFTYDGQSLTIGVTGMNSSDWTLRPILRLEPGDDLRQVSMPLTVTLALRTGEPSLTDAIDVRMVRDAHGRSLPPAMLQLTRCGGRFRNADSTVSSSDTRDGGGRT